LTRRLWAWRSEFGNDIHWSKKLGAQIVARGSENFWADLTALTD
jgi:acyl-CoA dehydrogenase